MDLGLLALLRAMAFVSLGAEKSEQEPWFSNPQLYSKCWDLRASLLFCPSPCQFEVWGVLKEVFFEGKKGLGGTCFYSEVERGDITGCSAKFLSANTRKRPLVSVHMCCSVGMAALVAVTFQVELVVITLSRCMEIPQNYTCAETSHVIYFLREFYIHMIYKQLILI